MKKDRFLKQLSITLEKLPKTERDDILQDYEEHFTFGLEEGKTEEEIVKSLGNPSQIAKELLASYHMERATASTTIGNIFRAMWAIAGLGFFNLVFVLGPAIALAAVIFSGWLVGIGFIVSPLLSIAEIFIPSAIFSFGELFLSLILSVVGCFIVAGMFYVTKFVKNIFIRYLKYNVELVKGGLKRNE